MQVTASPDEDIITANCRATQSLLNQIEKTDTGLRINRGYDYNEVLNLMFAMNARLASNKIAAPELSTLTADFESHLNTFRDDYNHYDDDINSAINANCEAQPMDFYNALEKARTSRATVQSDVDNLKQTMQTYYTDFNKVTETIV